jgi:hypothetical protein
MVNILLITKTGNVKLSNFEDENVNNLYKVAKVENKKHFKCVHEWRVKNEKNNTYDYCVYAKTTGNAGHENKYDFPPPIDNELYFDTCIIIKKKNNVLKSIRVDEWNFVYESLFGGFEDLGEEDSEDEEEEILGPDDKLTKSGYLQDDFVVDDDEFDEEDDEFDEEDDEFDEEDDESDEEDDEFDEEDDEFDEEDDEFDDDEFDDVDGDPDDEEEDDEDEDDINTENAITSETKPEKQTNTVFDIMLSEKDSELSE